MQQIDKLTIEQKLKFQANVLNAVEQAIIAIDMQGAVVYWNRFAEHLYGWSDAEAMGKRLRDLIAPRHDAQLRQEIMDKLRAGESWSGEFVVQHRDGREFVVDVVDAPIFDDTGALIGMVGASVDATQRLQHVAALKSSEEFSRSILESSADCIKVLNLDGSVLTINGPGLCAMEIDDFGAFAGRNWLNLSGWRRQRGGARSTDSGSQRVCQPLYRPLQNCQRHAQVLGRGGLAHLRCAWRATPVGFCFTRHYAAVAESAGAAAQ